MKKPIIGIIGKPVGKNEYSLWHQITCYDEARYLVVKNGGIAIELLPTEVELDLVDVEPNYKEITQELSKEVLEDLDRQIDLCDGFILQGGLMSCDFEIEIAKRVIEKDKPLIGICAGFNNILRALGGDVIKDETGKHDIYDINYRHSIELVEDSKLYELIGQKELEVNSLHFMIAKKEMVEPYAKISSYSYDGLVESFEVPDKKFIIGFKWHPELMIEEEYVDRIFREFIDKSRS